jgi:hypothetical protein
MRESVIEKPGAVPWHDLNLDQASHGPAGALRTPAPTLDGGAWWRLSQIGLGHAAYTAFNWFFDHVLYVYVVYRFGILYGGAVMTALSFVQCAATLSVYQRMGIDWVGAGFLHQLRYKANPSWLERCLIRATTWPPAALFTALCLLQDPFVTTAYFRRGRFGPLAPRDWRIFLGSVLVSNLYWIFVASAVGNLIAWTWHLCQGGGLTP